MVKVMAPAEMNDTFARAFNSRSLDGLLALYEPDAVLKTDGTARTQIGRDEIVAELRNLLNVPGTMVSRNNFCIEHGDLALLRADYAIHGPNGTVVAAGSTAELLRRQPDGRWLYVIDHAAGASLPRVDGT